MVFQVDQQLKAQEMSVDQQANYQLMGLQQAAFERRAILDQQAAAATLEYEQKRVQDEFAKTQCERCSDLLRLRWNTDLCIYVCEVKLYLKYISLSACGSLKRYEHRKKAAEKQAEMHKELARQKEEFARQQRAMQEAYAQQAAGLVADRQYAQPAAYQAAFSYIMR